MELPSSGYVQFSKSLNIRETGTVRVLLELQISNDLPLGSPDGVDSRF